MEGVNDLKGGVHRFGKDIVHENDGPVPGLGEDQSGLPLGIAVLPILRVDGPEDDGAPGPAFNALVQDSIWGAQQKVVVPQNLLEQGTGALHLGRKVRSVQPGEEYMVIGVNADLMPLPVHALYHIRVGLRLSAHQEEGGLHPALRQGVQQAGGGGAPGAVVEGQGDIPGSLLDGGGALLGSGNIPQRGVRLHGRRRQPQKARRQRQRQQEPPFPCFHRRPPPFQVSLAVVCAAGAGIWLGMSARIQAARWKFVWILFRLRKGISCPAGAACRRERPAPPKWRTGC